MDDYSFTWKTFSKHLNQTFHDLLEDKSFANVTLVCDDQRQLRAHKFVLSACSPVFKSVLSNTGDSNPLIILRGIHYEDMEGILQFMYQGEASVKKERMKDFMKAADELDVKIISQKYRKEKETAKIADTRKTQSPKQIRNEDEDKEETDEARTKETEDIPEAEAGQNLTKETIENRNKEITDTSIEDNVGTEDPVIVCEKNDTEGSKIPKTGLSVKDLMEMAFGRSSLKNSENEFGTLKEEDVKKEIAEDFSEYIIEGDSDSSLGERLEVTMEEDNKSYSSKKKFGGDLKKEMIRQEKDFSRLTEMSGKEIFACKKCDFKAKNLTTLRVHIKYDHRGAVSFTCDFCVFEAKQKASIQNHVKKMHTFVCQKCSYVGKNKMDLKFHINEAHQQPRDEDIKMIFSCEECDYIGKRERDLNSHMRLAHSTDEAEYDEKSFPCEDCDYVGKKKCNLKAHMRCHIPITIMD